MCCGAPGGATERARSEAAALLRGRHAARGFGAVRCTMRTRSAAGERVAGGALVAAGQGGRTASRAGLFRGNDPRARRDPVARQAGRRRFAFEDLPLAGELYRLKAADLASTCWGWGRAIVLVLEPPPRDPLAHDVLRERFGLTPQEARIASHDGHGNDEYGHCAAVEDQSAHGAAPHRTNPAQARRPLANGGGEPCLHD
jgi:hypothetical protein